MIGEPDQIFDADLALVGVVGMHAHGGVQVRVALGEREHPGEIGQGDADAERMRHPCPGHAREHRRDPVAEVIEIEVAMRIDQLHRVRRQ